MEHFTQSINGLELEFERRRITKEDTRELIYKEIDYHPDMLRRNKQNTPSLDFAALEKDYEEVGQDVEEDMKKKSTSSLIKIGICFQIVLSQIEPLTEQQLMAICEVKQATQEAEEAEEALSQGLDELNQSLMLYLNRKHNQLDRIENISNTKIEEASTSASTSTSQNKRIEIEENPIVWIHPCKNSLDKKSGR
ncbi:hypothetical protein Tco_1468345 [Tanacetum coccineum]